MITFGNYHDYILDTKIIMTFQKSHFQCIFNDFCFLAHSIQKVLSIFILFFYIGKTWPKGAIHFGILIYSNLWVL